MCSKDPSTQVGCVIVNQNNRIASLGYNGFPEGVEDSAERWENRDVKHLFVQHAERNALDNANILVDGCTLYATLKPCVECAKSIAQKRIKRVVCYKPSFETDRFKWNVTETIFKEAGIELVEIP